MFLFKQILSENKSNDHGENDLFMLKCPTNEANLETSRVDGVGPPPKYTERSKKECSRKHLNSKCAPISAAAQAVMSMVFITRT